jgi:hypothetical protein
LIKFFQQIEAINKKFFFEKFENLSKNPTILAIRSFKKRTANSRSVAFADRCERSPRFDFVAYY